MSRYNEALKLTTREMASQAGIEKTPEEWHKIIMDGIAKFRQDNQVMTSGLSDSEVWTILIDHLQHEG